MLIPEGYKEGMTKLKDVPMNQRFMLSDGASSVLAQVDNIATPRRVGHDWVVRVLPVGAGLDFPGPNYKAEGMWVDWNIEVNVLPGIFDPFPVYTPARR